MSVADDMMLTKHMESTNTPSCRAGHETLRPSRGELATVAALGVAAFFLHVATADSSLLAYDEGLILYGGAEVLGGAVPYRDFWSLYGPASDYLLGALFALFGESVLVGRALDALIRVAIVVVAYLLVRRFASRGAGICTGLLIVAMLTLAKGYEAPLHAATLFGLLAVLFASRALTLPRRPAFAILAGLSVALALAFRLDMGVYSFLAVAGGWAWLRWIARGRASDDRAVVASFLICVVGCVAVMAVLLMIMVPIQDLYDDFVRIPFTIYAKNRSLPFPLTRLLFRGESPSRRDYIAFLPYLVLFFAVADRWLGRNVDAQTTAPLPAMLFILTALFTLKGTVRVEVLHMAPALIAAIVLGTWLLARRTPRRLRSGRLAGFLVLLVFVGLGSMNGLLERALDRSGTALAWLLDDVVPRACQAPVVPRLACFSIDQDSAAITGYVIARSSRGDPIYVGTTRHDKLFMNNVELYFLTGRSAPTKWHDLHPGVQTTAAIQMEMIRDFTARPPRLVVLNSDWDAVHEPNASAESSGVFLLDQWLRAHYETVMAAGGYVVMRPRGQS